MDSLTLEMLPAAEGDALLLTYGDVAAPRYVLIDGGRRSTYKYLRSRLLEIPLNDDGHRFFELLIITHIDADHIEGIICLLQDEDLQCKFGDVWFNDWVHLEPLQASDAGTLGAKQGEFLAAMLEKQGLPWNQAFDGQAVVLTQEPEVLPVHTLAGDLTLTLLSPTVDTLIELREEWTDVIEDAGFEPGNREEALEQFEDIYWSKLPRNMTLGDERRKSSLDKSEPNGSSIAVLATYGGANLLLSGDAWPIVLRSSLDRLLREQGNGDGRVVLNAFKLPHHGSKKNITPQLMSVIECPTYMISTSGSRFSHPDVEAIDIIIEGHVGGGTPEVLFNYRSEDNDFYANNDDMTTAYESEAILSFTFDE